MSKTITLTELKQHKERSAGVWFAIHGKVYDVTKFLNEHPGGEEVLLENAGSDSTTAFEDVGHSTDAKKMLEQYYIGDLDAASAASIKGAASPASAATAKPSSSAPSPSNQSSSFQLLVPLLIVAAAVIYTQFIAK
ncbi:hypothetical protein CAOG_06628 [Capsaspora owczarzaki ATCC 30864]|uniref:Cytochrome b5 heme-binding domain-containing protein n=1 Tax=Capsaspora owczarzaki (strain ATCC 30864) TaxID=595528 RepID=A0A0D2WUE6_CAPO3|nr:hypothetical protein CAOG_06628 [Capsaspora owczarzaki ATCC 30864]KJE96285.1 hypothetical protein CAOG_006628 [Capsaspora owczarzaki ATCC 30864]|eukprot:XP_004344249.1 hypothetical protein CAOG_06628 [Capsaspora owczarzaki ATCC 30864]